MGTQYTVKVSILVVILILCGIIMVMPKFSKLSSTLVKKPTGLFPPLHRKLSSILTFHKTVAIFLSFSFFDTENFPLPFCTRQLLLLAKTPHWEYSLINFFSFYHFSLLFPAQLGSFLSVWLAWPCYCFYRINFLLVLDFSLKNQFHTQQLKGAIESVSAFQHHHSFNSQYFVILKKDS